MKTPGGDMDKKKKKRILRKFRMDEISGVDGMAQEGATVVLMKRDGEDELAKTMFNEALEGLELQEDIDEALREQWKLNEALRTSIREIVGDKDKYPDPMKAVRESLSEFAEAVSGMVETVVGIVEEGAEDEISKEVPVKTEGGKKFLSKDYAYTPDPKKSSTWKLRLTNTPGGAPDPRIVGAAVAALGKGFRGQKVQIPSEDLAKVKAKVKSAWLKANPDKSSEDLPAALKKNHKEADTMPKPDEKITLDELTKKVEEQETSIKKVNGELEVAKAYGELSDLGKKHYATLDEEGQSAFLKMTPEDRGKELKKVTDADPVVFTSADGAEFRKSDDPRLIKLAKKADKEAEIAKKEREESQKMKLEKRVKEDLQYLPGEQEVKIEVLKAVDGIEDEEVRKSAMEMLKAHNKAHEGAFDTTGSRGESLAKAEDKLNELAKKYAEEHKVSHAVAYDTVIQTEEGKKLYEETLS